MSRSRVRGICVFAGMLALFATSVEARRGGHRDAGPPAEEPLSGEERAARAEEVFGPTTDPTPAADPPLARDADGEPVLHSAEGDEAAAAPMAAAMSIGGCWSICGQMAPEGCYCDAYCEVAGDCCDDKLIECGTANTQGGICADPISANPLVGGPNPFERALDSGPIEFFDSTATEVDTYSYGAGQCPGETSGWGSGAPDHVYRLDTSVTGIYTLTLTPTASFDSNLYVVANCDNIADTCIAANEEIGGGSPESIDNLQLTAGDSVFVMVAATPRAATRCSSTASGTTAATAARGHRSSAMGWMTTATAWSTRKTTSAWLTAVSAPAPRSRPMSA